MVRETAGRSERYIAKNIHPIFYQTEALNEGNIMPNAEKNSLQHLEYKKIMFW
jgi:hypothetical protein